MVFNNILELSEFFVNEFQGDGLWSIIAKLSFYANINFLKEERNNIIFNDAKHSNMQILRNVENMAKLNLTGRGIKERETKDQRGCGLLGP